MINFETVYDSPILPPEIPDTVLINPVAEAGVVQQAEPLGTTNQASLDAGTVPHTGASEERLRFLAEEREAIAQAKLGNNQGIATLYRLHHTTVYRTLLGLSKNDHVAEDLTQEVFIKLMRHIGKHEGHTDGLRPWLFRVSKTTFLDYINLGKVNGNVVKLNSLQYDKDNMAPPFVSAELRESVTLDETVITQLDLRSHLRSILPSIPQDFLHAIIAVYVDGMDYAQAAQALDIKIGTLKSRINRGRVLLKEIAPPEGYLQSHTNKA